MGNLSFIVPTKNLEDFNLQKVFELLLEKFKDLNIISSPEHESIQVWTSIKNEILITDLYFNQDCYILEYEKDIELLKELIEETTYTELKQRFQDNIDGLIKLKELNPDLNNVIQMTYGFGIDMDLRNDIEFFIKDHFYAYLFDEGIHPEYMGPDYVRKPKKISKWKNFLKKYL